MEDMDRVIEVIVERLYAGNRVWTFGCGGQMLNAMHFAAELSGKFEEHEGVLPCVCLGTNVGELTAITNDFGWDVVFERLILANVNTGDVVVGFTVSGQGEYYRRAAKAVLEKDGIFVNVVGGAGHVFDWGLSLVTRSEDTPGIQEEQLRVIHKICGAVKGALEKEEVRL